MTIVVVRSLEFRARTKKRFKLSLSKVWYLGVEEEMTSGAYIVSGALRAFKVHVLYM